MTIEKLSWLGRTDQVLQDPRLAHLLSSKLNEVIETVNALEVRVEKLESHELELDTTKKKCDYRCSRSWINPVNQGQEDESWFCNDHARPVFPNKDTPQEKPSFRDQLADIIENEGIDMEPYVYNAICKLVEEYYE